MNDKEVLINKYLDQMNEFGPDTKEYDEAIEQLKRLTNDSQTFSKSFAGTFKLKMANKQVNDIDKMISDLAKEAINVRKDYEKKKKEEKLKTAAEIAGILVLSAASIAIYWKRYFG